MPLCCVSDPLAIGCARTPRTPYRHPSIIPGQVYVDPTTVATIHTWHTAETLAIEGVTESFMIQSQDRFENTLEWALSPGDEYQVTLVGVSHVHSRQPATVNPVTVTGKVTTLDPNTDGR